MTYRTIKVQKGGKRQTVAEGTPYACATAFYEHIARGSLEALARGERRVRADYDVRIIGPDNREVARGRGLDVFEQYGADFVGHSRAAMLLGFLRAMPVSVSALIGPAQSKSLARSAAEGRSISSDMLHHLTSRLIALKAFTNYAEKLSIYAAGEDVSEA